METLDGFPIEIRLDETLAKLKIDERRARKLRTDEIYRAALSLIHPKVLYTRASVTTHGKDGVKIGESDFTSRILAKNLDTIDVVFPYIVTIGEALETEVRACKNVLSQLVLDELGNAALESSLSYLERCVSKKYGPSVVSHMSPGQLDWSIDEQRELFAIFNEAEDKIGVRLTQSLLMIPRKSISGIMFMTDVPFISCQLCQRKNCSSRKAAYDERMSRTYFLEVSQSPGAFCD